MIDKSLLDALKLVQDENFAPDHIIEADLDYAVSQGSQGWGVKRDTAVILGLAKALRDALDTAEKVVTDHGKLKGLQMENGRLKKQLKKFEGRVNTLNAEILAKDILLKDLTKAAGSDIPSNDGVDSEED